MKKNKKLVVLLCIFVITLVTSISFAYFITQIYGNEDAKVAYVNSGTMSLEYDGTFITSLENALPGTTKTVNFSVTNTGTLPAAYAITMIDVLNNFEDKEDLVYTIESTNNGGTLNETTMPDKNEKIISPVVINPGTTQDYTLTVYFKETGDNQDDNQGKIFSGKIQIRDINNISIIEGNVTNYSEGDFVEIHSDIMSSQIEAGTYILLGIEEGNHTIYIKDKNGNIKGQKDISLVNGNENYISDDGSRIVFTKNNLIAKIDIDILDDGISLIGKEVVDNPLTLSENTILYTNISSDSPSTKSTPYYNHKSVNKIATYSTSIYSTIAGNKVIGSDYTFDRETGIYTLSSITNNQSYNKEALNKYTCNSNSSSCTTMYKIEEVNELTDEEIFYEQIESYTDENYTISNPVTVGTSYSFNKKTGKFTLENYERNVSISDDYLNYYICEENAISCDYISKIKRLDGNVIMDEDYYFSEAYYREIIEHDYTINSTSNENKVIGSDFTFDNITGKYSLIDTISNVSYNEDYKNYYTCNSSNTSCTTMYKIKEVDDTTLTKVDRYTRTNTSYNYITKATVYNNENDGMTNESGLFQTEDEKGISYYYRGISSNNYVYFAGILWRITRINGDGTVRLITQDTMDTSKFNNLSNDLKYAGYKYIDENGLEQDSALKESVDNWYNSLLLKYDDVIVNGDYCNDISSREENSITYFGAYDRLVNGQSTLKCENGLYELKVGLLSADEVALAGYTQYQQQPYVNNYNYLYNSSVWSTMSPSRFQKNIMYYYTVYPSYLNQLAVTNSYKFRPVINLGNDILVISGDGTVNNPYTIDSSRYNTTLVSEIMKNNVITTVPTAKDFYDGEPQILTFKDSVSSSSSYISNIEGKTDYSVATDYTFDKENGEYTLIDSIDNVELTNEYIGYYFMVSTNKRHLSKLTSMSSTKYYFESHSPKEETRTNNSGLYQTNDDDGISYYYRGDIKNNYVKFADKIWRITRINGDGSIRLLLNSSISNAAFSPSGYDERYAGYTYDNEHICTKENPCKSDYDSSTNSFILDGMTEEGSKDIKKILENWYIENLRDYDNKIVLSNFCNDTTGTISHYKGRSRLSYDNGKPSLLCPDTDKTYGGLYKLKIGLLSGDEIMMAGVGNSNYYRTVKRLLNGSYLYGTNMWSMTPAGSSFTGSSSYLDIYRTSSNGINISLSDASGASSAIEVRPVINLKPEITIVGGNGTSNYPFVVE